MLRDKIYRYNNLVFSSGQVTTVAGQTTSGYLDAMGTQAKFNYPLGIAVDSTGILYVADTDNHMLRKVTISGMEIIFLYTYSSCLN